ncbi:cytochrome P450 [Lineolata rhizophorae]|uniref:Cytochrome P450 n=1 Tax=Lineolata rhizophorae TaxID=578093 RepID=A0A6A6PDL6_9PEZI|nr:cytochrome P450 [Lineolata rhizophorae]
MSTDNVLSPIVAKLAAVQIPPSLLKNAVVALSGLTAIIVIGIVADYVRMLRLRRTLPPGPFPLPVVGNHLQIPKSKPWIAFEKWSKHYNDPLLTIWLGRRPIIVANDAWSASEMMEKKANIYSSRPRIVIMGDMFNATNYNQVVLTYGDRWRLHRRLMHTVVGSQAVRSWRDIQSAESKIMIRDLLDEPEDYVFHIERYACSVVSIIGWGRRINRKNDYVAQQALAMMNNAVDVVIPGAYWMESIPELTKLPKWLYKLPSLIWEQSNLMLKYFYALSLEGSKAHEKNFSARLIDEQEASGLTNEEVATLTGNLIGGGVDTTSSTILSFILAMCVFPEVQKKAQAEIDAVVGQDRAPVWEDEDSLPYVQAIVKETLRWRTVTILGGIPHAPIKDDIFRGYHIPAGTNITGNLWAIHRHPREFPDPDEFRPERYVDGLQFDYPNTRGHNAFGWGRRQCSGQPLAEQGLFLTLASMLWAYNIQPGLDKDGKQAKLDIFAYTDGENMRPVPFPARYTPRSKKIESIVRSEAAQAREQLSVFDGETKLTIADVM